ncbi:MAG: GFA family protein, partial [Alphaproteobacteria bacterium]|nr:GFA family protein [Alphaproteobacteria bacterium]
MRTYHGSCHCGTVTFEVEADLSKIIECNCSICTKKGALH